MLYTDALGSRLDCPGFIRPKHTAKTVKTKAKGITGTATVTGGLHTTGGATLAVNYTTTEADEKLDDRVSMFKVQRFQRLKSLYY
jgi:hypothetical protein